MNTNSQAAPSTGGDDVAPLRARIAALEAELDALRSSEDAVAAEYRLYAQLNERSSVGTTIYRLEDQADPTSLTLKAANEAAGTMIGGINLRAFIGRRILEFVPTLAGTPLLEQIAAVARSGKNFEDLEMAFDDEASGSKLYYTMRMIALPDSHVATTYEDITARKCAEEALQLSYLQEEKIRAQQNALEELSTPLIPITDEVVVMPLIGAMDSRRAQQVIEGLLEGVASSRATTAILDITGVAVVDTQVANALLRAAQAVKLLGARVMLTGIRPEVAQTLVGLGVDLGGIITHSTLQAGIALALHRK